MASSCVGTSVSKRKLDELLSASDSEQIGNFNYLQDRKPIDEACLSGCLCQWNGVEILPTEQIT